MMAPTEEFRIREGLIHRSAWKGNSANFAYWGFSEVGQEFIGNSSPVASVGALINVAGLITPPLVKGGACEAHHTVVEHHDYRRAGG
jgi:hypothetical protein